ncbi:restriction endonuclease [Planococcaceae bacterium Storch 2/2-2]|nr:restriction endonuclease [Planococcaceae bacterium Storch 2/2-2]
MEPTMIKPFQEVEYRIYGYTLPEVPGREGYVKIGDTTRDVKTRVFEQVGTAGLNPEILFERLAKKSNGEWFRDKELHRYLLLNNIPKKDFNGYADEWFYFNGDVRKAEELTDRFIRLDYEEVQITEDKSDYILRSEQRQAIEKTLEYYNSNIEEKEFLWNAKPRFGKTLTTYDFIRKIKAKNVLIVTNRPAIANSWFDDFQKFIAWQEEHMKFVSETDALEGKAMTRDEYIDFISKTECAEPTQIAFISLQDLKGAKFAGGPYSKLEWVQGLDWDVLVIDEAHEGIDTKKTDRAFNQIKRGFTLHLSGTPFKALANNKFDEEQIFNWSYVDEQEAKRNWNESLGSNPYENLPTLNLFTYQMSKMIEDKVAKGLQITEEKNLDYAFDLNEFFKVKDDGNFYYESSVLKFLDNLTKGKFPFASEQYRRELNHTFWLLPRVKAAKALEKLLKKHPVFKGYHVVLAAGDGVSLHDSLEEEALDSKENLKSFDKVKKAIQKYDKTITLSVGQLTTGVTIPEWTAVFMLNNIESPSLYFQAAFRAQNPYEFEKNGNKYRKENAYIFDFSPDRTLRLYDDLANNLTGSHFNKSEDRKENIRKLLNFFPVIAEDEEGSMYELEAEDVLMIPSKIASREVVKRGFMSNLLFANIAGIFSGDSPFKDILDKIPPEKNKKLGERKPIPVPSISVNEEGEIDIPPEVSIGTTKELFGEKVYVSDKNLINLIGESVNNEEKVKQVVKSITGSVSDGIENMRKDFNLTKVQAREIKKNFEDELKEQIKDTQVEFSNELKNLEEEYVDKKEELIKQSKDDEKVRENERQYEVAKKKKEKLFAEEFNKKIDSTLQNVVEEQIKKKEEKKKRTTEEDVRDHLRGFSRTIPAFLMAYGDCHTTLSNFEKNIDPVTFESITSITIEEFQKLRDGFSYVDEQDKQRRVPGLFNEVVFNASIREFIDTKERLSNYFDESLMEDIFDYIPPQKTNQIFTPKRVVQMMIQELEEENPTIFSDRTKKFADLYAKSGLYITEIVKKLNKGLKDEIPDEQERIKWILENQVYACAPSEIIYSIVKEFVYGNLEGISTDKLLHLNTLKLADQGILADEIYQAFGDEDLKFDVVIGNPPYQEETIGDNKTYAPPIYHKFLEESYKLAPKVMMIHPARFLFNAGSTPKAWNRKMLSDTHLKVVKYFDESASVFPSTDIKGGIAITYRDSNAKYGAIETFVVHDELRMILKKVKQKKFIPLSDIVHAPESYRFTKQLHKDFPEAKNLLSKGHEYSIMTNIFKKLPFVFLDHQPEVDRQHYKFYGRENNQRVYKWIRSDYVEDHPNLLKYKVFLAKSNGSGAFGESLTEPVVSRPLEGHTQTFISMGAFDTEYEAQSLAKYIKTKFLRSLLGTLKVTQDNKRATWSNIPYQSFTRGSDIDWSKTIKEIDAQLYKKYNLREGEIRFIEQNIKPME